MVAYYVNDALYDIEAIDVQDDFSFEGQYKIWKDYEEAKEELKKIIKADIAHLTEILNDL